MQEQLFFETPKDALDHAIRGIGGYQATAAHLWPAKPLKSAEVWLRNCLNADRPEKLDFDEIIEILRMARKDGTHCAMYAICDAVGYERPSIAKGKTQSQILAEKMQRAAAEFKHLADEYAAAIEGEKTERRFPKAV